MADFTYNTNVPNGPDDPADDQPEMLTNTQSINNWTNIDHIGYNTINGGLHKQVTMINESAPGFANGGTGVLYANNPVASSWPIWQNASTSYQIIGANANADAATSSFAAFGSFGTVTANYAQSAGWTFLPGGLIFQYASVTSTLGTPQISPSTIVVTFPVVFSTSNIVVSITPICKSGGSSQAHVASLQSGTLGTTGFTCNFDTSTTSYIGFTWTAIGK